MSKTVDFFLSLNALLGVYGVKTSRLNTNQDYWQAAKALWPDDVKSGQNDTLESLQQQIKSLSKTRRKTQAKANIINLPDAWRSDAPKHEYALRKARAGEAA